MQASRQQYFMRGSVETVVAIFTTVHPNWYCHCQDVNTWHGAEASLSAKPLVDLVTYYPSGVVEYSLMATTITRRSPMNETVRAHTLHSLTSLRQRHSSYHPSAAAAIGNWYPEPPKHHRIHHCWKNNSPQAQPQPVYTRPLCSEQYFKQNNKLKDKTLFLDSSDTWLCDHKG